MRRIYIAGPMSWIPYYNREAFVEAEKEIRELFPLIDEVFNPVTFDARTYGPEVLDDPNGDPSEAVRKGFSFRATLSADMQWLAEKATHIYMLKGWERSNGAKAEHALAVALGLEIIYE